MKVKIDGHTYWAKKAHGAPFIYIYDNFFKLLIDDINIFLSWGYYINKIREEREMETRKVVLDFKPEIPQLIVAEEQPNTKEIKILNVIKGQDAIKIFETLTGRGGKTNE